MVAPRPRELVGAAVLPCVEVGEAALQREGHELVVEDLVQDRPVAPGILEGAQPVRRPDDVDLPDRVLPHPRGEQHLGAHQQQLLVPHPRQGRVLLRVDHEPLGHVDPEQREYLRLHLGLAGRPAVGRAIRLHLGARQEARVRVVARHREEGIRRVARVGAVVVIEAVVKVAEAIQERARQRAHRLAPLAAILVVAGLERAVEPDEVRRAGKAGVPGGEAEGEGVPRTRKVRLRFVEQLEDARVDLVLAHDRREFIAGVGRRLQRRPEGGVHDDDVPERLGGHGLGEAADRVLVRLGDGVDRVDRVQQHLDVLEAGVPPERTPIDRIQRPDQAVGRGSGFLGTQIVGLASPDAQVEDPRRGVASRRRHEVLGRGHHAVDGGVGGQVLDARVVEVGYDEIGARGAPNRQRERSGDPRSPDSFCAFVDHFNKLPGPALQKPMLTENQKLRLGG